MADGIRSNFVSFYINSVYGRKWIKTVVSQQVGQANVNGTKLQALLIPLPPDTEQQKIIEEVESRFSVTEEIEAAIEINLKRAERLRQSILKKAFSGKLI
jgi:type I restriction enzyme S subunit